jgi:hypothetical protein
MAVAVSAGALAGGLLFGETWLLVFGAIFLAEELYETGVVALILRAAQRRERESAEPVSDVSPARARNHGPLTAPRRRVSTPARRPTGRTIRAAAQRAWR